jgi:hypothetical protein
MNQENKREDRQQMLEGIGRRVVGGLGRPPDLQRIQVRHLWDSCFRVNVFTGLDTVSPRMAHSYFLVTDDAGVILSSAPPLVRLYEAAATGAVALSHGPH